MPNWCENFLLVEGTKHELKRFLKQCASYPDYYDELGWSSAERRENVRVCLSGTVPLPEDVIRDHFEAEQKMTRRIARLRWIPGLWLLLAGRQTLGWRLMNGLLRFVGLETWPDLQKRRESWYSWSCANWGTKWDVSPEVRIAEHLQKDPASVEFEFDTAWGPPGMWLIKTAEIYPDLTFRLEYEEPGMVFSGLVIARKGSLVSEEYGNMLLNDLRVLHPEWEWIDSSRKMDYSI